MSASPHLLKHPETRGCSIRCPGVSEPSIPLAAGEPHHGLCSASVILHAVMRGFMLLPTTRRLKRSITATNKYTQPSSVAMPLMQPLHTMLC